MKYLVLISVLVCLLAVVSARGRAGPRRSPARLRAQPVAASSEDNEQPSPYQFNYSSDDGESKQERQEQGDETGAVKGSYSYTDANGLYRTVTYIADANGFRVLSIQSNEPGMGTDSPADVEKMDIQEPPAGIYESKPRKSKKRARNY